MQNIESLQKLLKTEVTRREFLLYIAGAFLALIGITETIKKFSSSFNSIANSSDNSGSYGWSGDHAKPHQFPVTKSKLGSLG